MSTENFNNLSIIIPTINERQNLERLVFVLRDLYPGAHILVSDDGSTDGTSDFIDDLIKTGFESPVYFLDRKNNSIITNNTHLDPEKFNADSLNIRKTPGLTAAVLDALKIIDTDRFAVIDADFQHPPKIIGDMYKKLDDFQLVCAYRTKLEGFPWYRKVITKIGTAFANFALPKHSRVNDPLSGAFSGNIKSLEKYIFDTSAFKLEGFKILFDLLRNIPSEINIAQTGYEFKMREKGQSKISFKHLWAFFSAVLDRKTKKFFLGLALLIILLTIGTILFLIYGDIGLSRTLRDFAKARPGFLKFSKFITDYGNPFYYTIFSLTFITGLIKKNKKLVRIGLIYIIVQLIACLLITGSLKSIVGRPRPGKGFEHHHFTMRSTYKSFPSGHTTDAFASAGVLWIFLKSYPLSIISFCFSLFIGLTRIFVGSHYFLDVLGGMTIGLLTAMIVTRKKLQNNNKSGNNKK
jgi:membrane-associated phospholipid phosphatase